MEWSRVRAHYAALFARAQAGGCTQAAIAARGGLGQSAISKLLANDYQGPSVETFLKALAGLGVDPVSFFAALTGHDIEHAASIAVSPPSLEARVAELEDQLASLASSVAALRSVEVSSKVERRTVYYAAARGPQPPISSVVNTPPE